MTTGARRHYCWIHHRTRRLASWHGRRRISDPTLVLLFGADIKFAGSLSLAVSLPTMLVGFARYSRDDSFSALRENWLFLLVMAARSLAPLSVAACSD
jgi:hypothetical protein